MSANYTCFIKELSNLVYTPRFLEVIDDLEKQKNQISHTAYQYALDTIRALAIIEKNASTLAQILSENQRNQEITNLTNLIAEPGLIEGDSCQIISGNIHRLIETFFEAFAFDKNVGDTKSLYADGFKGPPCFNGRMITLQEYIDGKQKLMDPKQRSDVTSYDKIAYNYTELLYQCNSKTLPKFNEFKKFLENLSNYSKKHQFLVESNGFINIYRRACELYV